MTAITVSSSPSDRWLRLGRAAWYTTAALVLGLTVANLPLQWIHGQILCSGAACAGDQFSPAGVVQLQRAGLSLGLFVGYTIASNTLVMLVFVLVGGVIFWRRSNDLFGIFTAITLALAGYLLTIGGPPLPPVVTYYPALGFLALTLNLLANLALVLFFCLFPDGRFVPRWIVWLLPLLLAYEVIKTYRPDLLGDNPFIILGVIGAVAYRYARVSNAIQRQQTKWVVLGSILGLIGVISVITFSSLVPQTSTPPVLGLAVNTAWALFTLLIPASIGMAILRSHLWDIDLLIRRSLIYGALTVLLVLVYLGAVVSLQAIFTAITGDQRSELVTVISTLVIAALFGPLRQRLQALIDRRLYRSKYDAARTLAAFAATARDETDLDRLAERLVSVVEQTMQPEAVGLWLNGSAADRHPPADGHA